MTRLTAAAILTAVWLALGALAVAVPLAVTR